MQLEINLTTNTEHVIVYASLALRFYRLGVISSRNTGRIMADEQLTLAICIAVIIRILIVESKLHIIIYIEIQANGEVLTCTTVNILVVQIQVVVTQEQLNIPPLATTRRLRELTFSDIETLFATKEHCPSLEIPPAEIVRSVDS